MKKLLIAVSSDLLGLSIQANMKEEFDIVTCYSGLDALELIRSFDPDMLMIDLMLPEMDGISVLRAARFAGKDMRVLTVSPVYTEYTYRALEELKVDYMMVLPLDLKQAQNHLRQLSVMDEPEPVISQSEEQILCILGFIPGTNGYRCTAEGLHLLRRDLSVSFSGSLYPDIAHNLNMTVTQVEKAIRDAVHTAWENRNDQLWRMYFPADSRGRVALLSNTKFLRRLAQLLDDFEHRQAGA